MDGQRSAGGDEPHRFIRTAVDWYQRTGTMDVSRATWVAAEPGSASAGWRLPLRAKARARHSRRYVARLLDGPLAGTLVRLNADPDGEPSDVLPIRGERRGAYLLAGLPGMRGVLPYRWFTTGEWAGLRRLLHARGRSDQDG